MYHIILGSISIKNNFCNNQNLNKFFVNLNLFSNQSATKLNLKKKDTAKYQCKST